MDINLVFVVTLERHERARELRGVHTGVLQRRIRVRRAIRAAGDAQHQRLLQAQHHVVMRHSFDRTKHRGVAFNTPACECSSAPFAPPPTNTIPRNTAHIAADSQPPAASMHKSYARFVSKPFASHRHRSTSRRARLRVVRVGQITTTQNKRHCDTAPLLFTLTARGLWNPGRRRCFARAAPRVP